MTYDEAVKVLWPEACKGRDGSWRSSFYGDVCGLDAVAAYWKSELEPKGWVWQRTYNGDLLAAQRIDDLHVSLSMSCVLKSTGNFLHDFTILTAKDACTNVTTEHLDRLRYLKVTVTTSKTHVGPFRYVPRRIPGDAAGGGQQ